jgi:hypothetical protein
MVHAKSLLRNPASRQKSSSFGEDKDTIPENFDYVLKGAPPVELISDPANLATQSEGVLLVMDAQGTRMRPLWDTMRSLETVAPRSSARS